ncbi:MAG: metallophosphoesterase [Eubacteriales bacterium]|nr:metallophosphoesterase [Eubacteriales bacterium]
MIYITGDTHGEMNRLNTTAFPEQKSLTKEDVVIICGDFGLVWDYRGESPFERHWLDWLEQKTFTTVFVDGNHECFARLKEYPVRKWRGGSVHEIRPSVLHLMRGEIFEISKKRIFAFGGASSHDMPDGLLDPEKDAGKIKSFRKRCDKYYRVIGQTWWSEELPSQEEMERGRNNLETCGNQVDFIVTHSPSDSVLRLVGEGDGKRDILTEYLEEIKQKAAYRKWFCGHLHCDRSVSPSEEILYERIVRIL